jgi:phytoene desaturase
VRSVTGPTDKVVIVGAGLGGLSAAIRLAATGREVTVLERDHTPGGRAGIRTEHGYSFDTGPTVLTMTELIDDLLACVGERTSDWLELRPLAPAYRANYPDGSQLDVYSDTDQMAAEIERVCGPAESAGYRRFVSFLRRLYRAERDDFIARNFDTPLDLVTVNLARLMAMGAFRRMAGKVGSYLHDQRTRQVFSFQAMYAGLSPFQALAIYAVIAYMDSVNGVYFPVGGMHAVSRALADVATRHGVHIEYGTEVAKVELRGNRAETVRTAAGERIPADVVVLNPDLPVAYRDLLGRRPRRLDYSPSCFILHAGSRATYPELAHHNIHFGASWQRTFDELLTEKRLMRDPSFLVTSPTRSDAGLAPPDKHIYYALFPTPNTTAGLDWSELAKPYRDEVIETLESRGYPGFGRAIEVDHVVTPRDWAQAGMAAGTPFAAAHSLFQTGPFRPGNLFGENVVFTGSGTQPGVGVPMVLISGQLAAQRVTGR